MAKKKKNRPPGIVSKVNGFLRGIKIGLPAIGAFTKGAPLGVAAVDAGGRYSGFDFNTMQFDVPKATATAGFYAGNIVERKVLSLLRIPQMAGQKKLLSVAAQYLPEIQAAGEFMAGESPQNVASRYGGRSIGYRAADHSSWFDRPNIRSQFLQTLAARALLGLVSRFAGPFINPHLPKGIGI